MNELSVGFSQDSDTKFYNKTSTIHTALTTQPGLGYFPVTVPTMAAYKTAIDAYQGALSGDGAAPNVAARKSTREALMTLTQKLAAGLELSADGDLVKLAGTGFETKAKPTRSSGPLPAPENLRVKTTGTAGEAVCKCAAVPLGLTYEASHTLDPINGPWTFIPPVTNSQSILFTSLSRGKDYYFRVRAIGATGPSGWSDVATMMVV
ncbi:MAG: fibronectin type III domain-containing protein [Luteolibacter sp.]